MLNVGIVGLGNTGNQVAQLAKQRLGIPAIAINSCEKDLETIMDGIPKKLITSSNKTDSDEGSGRVRSNAKKYLHDSIMSLIRDQDMIDVLSKLDVCFVVSSTGGGTGSGTAPIMSNIINDTFKDLIVILVGVLPVNDESLDAQVNTLEYLDEVYNILNGPTHMLYDNDKYYGQMSSNKILEKVNNEIVSDIDVLRLTYNYTTRYDSIDNGEAKRLLTFPGRMVVSRLEDFKEKDCDSKSIEDMIIHNIKTNAHVETQRDRSIRATGIITNLSQTLNDVFNDNIPKVKEFIGEPVHSFKHICINDDRKMPNNVFIIMSGLSKVNDKINIISDRVDDIKSKRAVDEAEDALSKISLDKLSEQISDKREEKTDDNVNIRGIFGKFGI